MPEIPFYAPWLITTAGALLTIGGIALAVKRYRSFSLQRLEQERRLQEMAKGLSYKMGYDYGYAVRVKEEEREKEISKLCPPPIIPVLNRMSLTVPTIAQESTTRPRVRRLDLGLLLVTLRGFTNISGRRNSLLLSL